jgi:hypothetical protein
VLAERAGAGEVSTLEVGTDLPDAGVHRLTVLWGVPVDHDVGLRHLQTSPWRSFWRPSPARPCLGHVLDPAFGLHRGELDQLGVLLDDDVVPGRHVVGLPGLEDLLAGLGEHPSPPVSTYP